MNFPGKTALIACFLAVSIFSVPAGAETYLTREEALDRALPGSDTVEKKVALLTAAQKKKAGGMGAEKPPSLFVYYVGFSAGEPVGFAIVDKVSSKSSRFKFIVAVRPDMSIKHVEFLKMEGHLPSRRAKDILAPQFRKKSNSDSLKVGKDINRMSGATLSSRAITSSVRKNLVSLSVVASEHAAENESGGSQVSRERNEVRLSRLVMGTTLEVTIYGRKDKAESAADAVFKEISRLEDIFSSYKEESELSSLNLSAGSEALTVSDDMMSLMQRSVEYCRLTGGAFDITAGPAINLWRNNLERGSIPSRQEINRAAGLTGCDRLEIDEENRTVFLPQPGMKLNMGAIAKGYALDQAASLLKEHGLTSAYLNFGGQILALGSPPGRDAWPVSVRNPLGGTKPVFTGNIKNKSVATSADYERGIEVDGKLYSHIIDPNTARPASSNPASATVIDASAARADALSTALYVMGYERGAEFAVEQEIAAHLISKTGEIFKTESFKLFTR